MSRRVVWIKGSKIAWKDAQCLMFLENATYCICSCLPCQCVPLCACRRVPTLHRSARPGNSKLKEAPWENIPTCAETNTHTDSSLALRAVCINACSNGCRCNNREAQGSDHYPRAHPLTLDRWTRLLFSPSPWFYGTSNYAYTPHQNKAQHAMPLVWRGSELVRSNKASLRSSPVIWRPMYGHGEVKVKVLQPSLLPTDCLVQRVHMENNSKYDALTW